MSPWASGDSLTPSTLNSKIPSWFTNRTAMFNVVDYGADPTGNADSTAAILAADAAATTNPPLSGGVVVFPEGSFYAASTLTYLGAPWVGAGRTNTQIVLASSTTGINAVGTSGARRVVNIRGMTLNGGQSGNSATGLALGWNQRSLEATNDILVTGFGGPGISFVDQNWIVNFYNTWVYNCGIKKVGGAAGVSALTAANNLLNVNFYGLVVESCGTVGSGTGGGVHFQTGGFLEQIGFHGGCLEDNYGFAEAVFVGGRAILLSGTYFEGTSASTASNAVVFDGSQFAISGGYFTTGATNTATAILAKNASVGAINGASIDPRWLGGVMVVQDTSQVVASGVSRSGGTVTITAGASFNDLGNLAGQINIGTGGALVNGNAQITGRLDLAVGAAADFPTLYFHSEQSLGLYRSAASTIAQSYGWLASNFISSSTTAASGATAKLPNQGQLYFSVLSLTSNGGEFGFRSGNTVYRFSSVAVG